MSPAQTGTDRGTERQREKGGGEQGDESLAQPYPGGGGGGGGVRTRTCMCSHKCQRITLSGWLNWHRGAPEKGAAADDQLSPTLSQTCTEPGPPVIRDVR